ncbi:MAG: hypothetical protein M3Z66_12030 [Chloroflexota bacterium]|nr:hypothetical protein [Chloroflexota bacterium]
MLRPVTTGRLVEFEKRLDAIVWLDQPVLVQRTLAGHSYDVRIGGRPMLLTLPKDGPTQVARSQNNGPSAIPSFPPPSLTSALNPKIRAVTSLSLPVPPQVLAVAALRLRWDDDKLESTLEELGGTKDFAVVLKVWLTTVQDWLAAWSGNVRERVHREGPPHFRVAAVRKPEAPAAGGGGLIPVIVQGQRSFTADEIRGSFAAASGGFPLPLEHQLIGEAAVLAARGATREAVIAACSAAEVALSGAAMRALLRTGTSDRHAKSILKGVSGVVELYRLNAARRGGLPVSIGNVLANLAGPRNDAVHAGDELNADVARRALDTARKLVSVSALPPPRAVAAWSRGLPH